MKRSYSIILLALLGLACGCSTYTYSKYSKEELADFSAGKLVYIGDYASKPSGISVIDVEKVPGRRDKGVKCRLSVVSTEAYKDRFLGSVVEVLKFDNKGRVKIISLVNDCSGWISTYWLAKTVTQDDCLNSFTSTKLILCKKKAITRKNQ